MSKPWDEIARESEDKLEKAIAERNNLKEHLKLAVGRIENLYRLIYGYNVMGEKPSNEQVYIAERYCIDTVKLLADENGWTGRKCKVCEGHGVDNENHGCSSCAGTGEENISPTA